MPQARHTAAAGPVSRCTSSRYAPWRVSFTPSCSHAPAGAPSPQAHVCPADIENALARKAGACHGITRPLAPSTHHAPSRTAIILQRRRLNLHTGPCDPLRSMLLYTWLAWPKGCARTRACSAHDPCPCLANTQGISRVSMQLLPVRLLRVTRSELTQGSVTGAGLCAGAAAGVRGPGPHLRADPAHGAPGGGAGGGGDLRAARRAGGGQQLGPPARAGLQPRLHVRGRCQL